jgi:hypothetical protein
MFWIDVRGKVLAPSSERIGIVVRSLFQAGAQLVSPSPKGLDKPSLVNPFFK